MPPVSNFLDTNILIYALSDDQRAEKAQALLSNPFVIGVQTLNEFANVARKKLGMSWIEISDAVKSLIGISNLLIPASEKTTIVALELAPRYNFSFYDAVMIATAIDAGCTHYYSEDMHHGLIVESQMMIINPFR